MSDQEIEDLKYQLRMAKESKQDHFENYFAEYTKRARIEGELNRLKESMKLPLKGYIS